MKPTIFDHGSLLQRALLVFWVTCLTTGCLGSLPPMPLPAQAAAPTPAIAPLKPSLPSTALDLAGCALFPPNNIWNTPVDNLPVDSHSNTYIQTIGADQTLHPDFGAGTWPETNGFPIGIPYNLVSASQQKLPVDFYYPDESDPGPYPIPPNPLIEGDPNSGDRHILVLDTGNCILYEIYDAWYDNGGWHAGSGAIFDLHSHALRPAGWTSADAAGLPILPGLVRYDEIQAGEITHAIRFTVEETRAAFIWPARHHAETCGQSDPLTCPPMGQRFRLKSDYDISGFTPQVQIILRAMQKYGLVLADNGSNWYVSGVPDERWDNDSLVTEFRQVPGSAFEAVDVSSLMLDPNSGQVRGDKLIIPLLVQTFTPHP